MTQPSSTSSTAEKHTPALKAGASQVDITPPLGIPLTGFIARLGPSTGVHDPLFARALALESGGERALLIACDLLALDAAFVATARAAIQAATGVPEGHILIACTHTHSGPATIFLRGCGEVDRPYLERLQSSLVCAAQEAVANLREVRLGVGRGQVERGALNRRQPSAPIDSDLEVISFQDTGGKILAILVNYACHAVCLDSANRLISADYPGYLARALQEETGGVVLFTNGATGDINPQRMGAFSFAQELGDTLAREARRVLATLTYHETASLRVVGENLNLPLRSLPTRSEIEPTVSEYRRQEAEAREAGEVVKARIAQAMVGWAEATLAGVANGNLPTDIPAELQAISLGEAVLLGIPGELFSALGQAIKSRAPTHAVMVIGYANADIGYIPTRQAYVQGGYEIEDAYKYYGYPAALAPEAGEQVLQYAERLIA